MNIFAWGVSIFLALILAIVANKIQNRMEFRKQMKDWMNKHERSDRQPVQGYWPEDVMKDLNY